MTVTDPGLRFFLLPVEDMEPSFNPTAVLRPPEMEVVLRNRLESQGGLYQILAGQLRPGAAGLTHLALLCELGGDSVDHQGVAALRAGVGEERPLHVTDDLGAVVAGSWVDGRDRGSITMTTVGAGPFLEGSLDVGFLGILEGDGETTVGANQPPRRIEIRPLRGRGRRGVGIGLVVVSHGRPVRGCVAPSFKPSPAVTVTSR